MGKLPSREGRVFCISFIAYDLHGILNHWTFFSLFKPATKKHYRFGLLALCKENRGPADPYAEIHVWCMQWNIELSRILFKRIHIWIPTIFFQIWGLHPKTVIMNVKMLCIVHKMHSAIMALFNRSFSRRHYNDVILSAMASQITILTIVYASVYSGTDRRKHQSSV